MSKTFVTLRHLEYEGSTVIGVTQDAEQAHVVAADGLGTTYSPFGGDIEVQVWEGGKETDSLFYTPATSLLALLDPEQRTGAKVDAKPTWARLSKLQRERFDAALAALFNSQSTAETFDEAELTMMREALNKNGLLGMMQRLS